MKKTLIYLPVGILTIITASSGAILASASVSAELSTEASVTVNSTCSFNDNYDYTSRLTLNAGTTSTTEGNGKPTAQLTCNNPAGFGITGVGYSPTSSSEGAGVEGATAMYGTSGTIATGTSGDDSYWGFKITTLTASTANPTNNYPNYSSVPSVATSVVEIDGSSSGVVTATFRPDYQVHVSTTQAAGTYTGAMKYTVVSN